MFFSQFLIVKHLGYFKFLIFIYYKHCYIFGNFQQLPLHISLERELLGQSIHNFKALMAHCQIIPLSQKFLQFTFFQHYSLGKYPFSHVLSNIEYYYFHFFFVSPVGENGIVFTVTFLLLQRINLLQSLVGNFNFFLC